MSASVSASGSGGSVADIPRMSGIVVTEAPAQTLWKGKVESRLESLEKNITAMRVEGLVQEASTGLIMSALQIPQAKIDAIRSNIMARLEAQEPVMVGGVPPPPPPPPPAAPQEDSLPSGVDPLLQPSPSKRVRPREEPEPQPQPLQQPQPEQVQIPESPSGDPGSQDVLMAGDDEGEGDDEEDPFLTFLSGDTTAANAPTDRLKHAIMVWGRGGYQTGSLVPCLVERG